MKGKGSKLTSLNVLHIFMYKQKWRLYHPHNSFFLTKQYLQTLFARIHLPQSACEQQIEDDHNQHESPTTELFCQGINCRHSSQGEGSPFMKIVPWIGNWQWGGARSRFFAMCELDLSFVGVQKSAQYGLGHISSGKC